MTDSAMSLDTKGDAINDARMDELTLLYRIDRTRNMARFYSLSVEPTLFGGSALVRRWGRIGTAGRQKIELFDTIAQAADAYHRLTSRKLRRGYIDNAAAQQIVTPQGQMTV